MGLFSSARQSYLGIDIGDSSLKMVELEKRGKKIVLTNYGFSENLSKQKFTSMEDAAYLAKVINKVRQEVGITATRASVSLPSFSVFSSVVNLSGVNKKNLGEKVSEEAKKIIPLPLDEMALAWNVIPSPEGDANTKVFLTGSPKKLVRRYINIFNEAKIELVNLETETFSLIRSLLGNDKSTVMIIELGANSTDLCVVKESIPYLNRSISVSGNSITEFVANKLHMDTAKAEQLKLDLGSGPSVNPEVPAVILEAVTPIITEIKYMMELFQNTHNQKIEKIVLSGGGSLLVNLAKSLEDNLNIQVILGNPWFRVAYPVELAPILSEVGPKLAVAVGLALRGIE